MKVVLKCIIKWHINIDLSTKISLVDHFQIWLRILESFIVVLSQRIYVEDFLKV